VGACIKASPPPMPPLTKSLFKTGSSCPTKLFYTRKPDQFPDKNADNDFLKGLAEGGYQVGAYAQLHFPGGTLITTRDKLQALAQTRELLQRPSTVIFEATIGHGFFYLLVDILVKDGDTLTLIEVKSKKYEAHDVFFSRSGRRTIWLHRGGPICWMWCFRRGWRGRHFRN